MNNKIKCINIKVVLFISALIFTNLGFAQVTSRPSHKHFAFMAGMNLSNMNFNKGYPPPAVRVPATWKTGIMLGFSVDVPLVKNVFLQPGYSYSHRNGSDKTTQVNYSMDYVSFPLLLKFQISSCLNIVAGPQAELLVHASSKSNGLKNNITHDVEERGVGFTAGLDVEVIKSILVSARFFNGLNHIGIGQRSNVKEFKYGVFNLGIGMPF